MKNAPIFIVGAPRSGTTLLSAFLTSHSQIACGPESHFFNKLNKRDLNNALQDINWPHKAADLVTSLKLSGQSVHELFGLTPDKITSHLMNRPPSIRTLLESLTIQYAQKMDKPRWAEKTPNHVLHLPLIRNIFPESPIIRIIRDPRDSAMSMRKLPWASQSILANCYLWNEWFSASHAFCTQDKKTLTIRYEDLVLEPKLILSKICDHIGEDFEETMLNFSKSAHSVSSPKEYWKAQVAKPLALDRLYVWKRELPSYLHRATTYACLPGVETFGYDGVESPKSIYSLYQLDREFIEKNESFFVELANNGKRLVSLTEDDISKGIYSSNRDIFICHLPALKGKLLRRISILINLLIYLLTHRIRGYSTIYFQDSLDLHKTQGPIEILRIIALKILGSKSNALIV